MTETVAEVENAPDDTTGDANRTVAPAGTPVAVRVTDPGALNVEHGWAYLPDVAETMVRLALDDANLAPFEVFHMRGHTLTGAAMIAAFNRVAGRKLAVNRLPWFAIRAIAPLNETFREMLEMRYLWEEPVLMDNARLTARLGAEPHTPIDEALRAALTGLGVLPQPLPLAA